MKKIALILLLILPGLVQAQSKVMRDLADDFPESRVIMIYHSSLTMLNMEDDPDFARMIYDIEKIKVLIIDKEDQEEGYSEEVLPSLKADLVERNFEELMIVKSKEYDIGVYILEDDDEIEGFFFVMDETDSLVAIDLLGSMPVGDISQLIDKIKQAKDF